ncbi:protein serine/threonine phosphatase 2C family protein, partial [archaeon]
MAPSPPATTSASPFSSCAGIPIASGYSSAVAHLGSHASPSVGGVLVGGRGAAHGMSTSFSTAGAMRLGISSTYTPASRLHQFDRGLGALHEGVGHVGLAHADSTEDVDTSPHAGQSGALGASTRADAEESGEEDASSGRSSPLSSGEESDADDGGIFGALSMSSSSKSQAGVRGSGDKAAPVVAHASVNTHTHGVVSVSENAHAQRGVGAQAQSQTPLPDAAASLVQTPLSEAAAPSSTGAYVPPWKRNGGRMPTPTPTPPPPAPPLGHSQAASSASVAVDLSRDRHGHAGLKGARSRMEDAHTIIPDLVGHMTAAGGSSPILAPPASIAVTDYYGIFDGHGGRYAADFACERMHRAVASHADFGTDLAAAMRASFAPVDAAFLAEVDAAPAPWPAHLDSGTTALIACIREMTVFIAHVGDCRAIVCHADGGVKQLTSEHSPAYERERIEAAGGWVTEETDGNMARMDLCAHDTSAFVRSRLNSAPMRTTVS